MDKLPTFNSSNHEFTYFATLTINNTMTLKAIESYLNIVTEAVNEIIGELANEDSNIDLESFKSNLLNELAAILNQKTEFEFSNSLFDLLGTERTDLKECVKLLEAQLEALTQRVSRIESALGHEKVDTCQSTVKPETKHMKIVLIDGLNRESVADILVAENVNPYLDKFLVEVLNREKGTDESWFVLKSDDYRLSRGIEDLI